MLIWNEKDAQNYHCSTLIALFTTLEAAALQHNIANIKRQNFPSSQVFSFTVCSATWCKKVCEPLLHIPSHPYPHFLNAGPLMGKESEQMNTPQHSAEVGSVSPCTPREEYMALFHHPAHLFPPHPFSCLVKVLWSCPHFLPCLVQELNADTEELLKWSVMGEEHGMEIIAGLTG